VTGSNLSFILHHLATIYP